LPQKHKDFYGTLQFAKGYHEVSAGKGRRHCSYTILADTSPGTHAPEVDTQSGRCVVRNQKNYSGLGRVKICSQKIYNILNKTFFQALPF